MEDLKKAYLNSINKRKPIYISINSNEKDLIIPNDLKNTGEVVLNISPSAIRQLDFGDKYLEFRCSFDGIVHSISIPYDAIIALIEGDATL